MTLHIHTQLGLSSNKVGVRIPTSVWACVGDSFETVEIELAEKRFILGDLEVAWQDLIDESVLVMNFEGLSIWKP